MTIDIGIASYRSPEKLRRTLETIHANTLLPFRLMVWHNTTDDAASDAALRAVQPYLQPDSILIESPNVGYAGAVNGMLRVPSSADYFLYCDNDIEVQTRGWETRMGEVLEHNSQCTQVFPGSGHYGFHNGRYDECLWNAGYCWMLRRNAAIEMDELLGHHEEVDMMIRLRLAGFTIGCCPDVSVLHHQTSTNSPDSEARIRAGVIRWMNKWNRYFCGDALTYPDPLDPNSRYDPRALRYTDWPPCALYLERWTLAQFPEWNKAPRVVATQAGPMDAIEVLKPTGCYKGRAV